MKKALCFLLILVFCFIAFDDAEAKRRKRRAARRRYTGPPPTHPVILWSRTLADSKDREQRKVAAFKLSQYSQTIYQDSIIQNLIRCMRDTDVQIKVLCAKAMGRAGTQGQAEGVRKALLEQYNADPALRNTIVRTFVARKDGTEKVHDQLLKSLKGSQDVDEMVTLLNYFEDHGTGNGKFVDSLTELYQKNENIKVRRSVVKALAVRAQGQESVVALMASCADSKDTPLALNCLSGLQSQARKDARAWPAITKTIESSDPDVLMATLDVINALPEAPRREVALRLVEIIDEVDDSEVQEKAVLALGVCGDHSEKIVKTLAELLEDKGADEAVRIAAALVLGKQADSFPEEPKSVLSKCNTEGKSQSLRTACQLGLQELESRKAIADKNAPAATGASVLPPRETSEISKDTSDGKEIVAEED